MEIEAGLRSVLHSGCLGPEWSSSIPASSDYVDCIYPQKEKEILNTKLMSNLLTLQVCMELKQFQKIVNRKCERG